MFRQTGSKWITLSQITIKNQLKCKPFLALRQLWISRGQVDRKGWLHCLKSNYIWRSRSARAVEPCWEQETIDTNPRQSMFVCFLLLLSTVVTVTEQGRKFSLRNP